jgi:hypothetical protein
MSRRNLVLSGIAGLSVAAAFFAVGWVYLGVAHPSEDAYILFRYVENVAGGHGYVFNPGGPRAEGASDFLWMLLLALGVALGADVVLASLAGNALAAGVTAALLVRAIGLLGAGPRPERLLLLAYPLLLLVQPGAIASYLGFGASAGSLLYLAAAVVLVEARGRAVLALPWIAIALALFRPDAVLPGVAFALLGMGPARRAGLARPYLAALAGSAAVGMLYLAWRVTYFGLWLPLPVYVKTRPALPAGDPAADLLVEQLPGLWVNYRWLIETPLPLPALAALALLVGLLVLAGDTRWRRLLGALVPALVLLAVLCRAHQAQNVAMRFQAPASLLLLFSVLQATAWLLEQGGRPWSRRLAVGLALAAVTPAAWAGVQEVERLLSHPERTYRDVFAPALGRFLEEDDVFALTEAGAFAYWSRARVVDLVGLNDPHTARFPPTVDYIRRADPDVLMFSQVYTLDPRRLVRGAEAGLPLVAIPPERLREALLPRFRALFDGDVRSYDDPRASAHGLTQVAPVIMSRFLLESGRYDVFAVDSHGGGRYYHVFALRKDWPHKVAARLGLASALRSETGLSYRDARRRDPRGLGLLPRDDTLVRGRARRALRRLTLRALPDVECPRSSS